MESPTNQLDDVEVGLVANLVGLFVESPGAAVPRILEERFAGNPERVTRTQVGVYVEPHTLARVPTVRPSFLVAVDAPFDVIVVVVVHIVPLLNEEVTGLLTKRMIRRGLLSRMLTTIPVTVAGCSTVDVEFGDNHVDLLLLNTGDRRQSIEVTVETKSGSVIFDRTVRLGADEHVLEEDALSGRRLVVTAKIGELPGEQFEYRASNCENEKISIHAQEGPELRITQSTCSS